jgi:hypothetical protein
MNTWALLENISQHVPTPVKLSLREARVVKEALAHVMRDILESHSAWDMLENWGALNESDVTSVLGLSPYEVEIIKGFERGVQSKRGNTGEVVQLTPKTWLKIIQKLEQNSDYYNTLLGGMSDVESLISKIRSRLSLDMGKKPASEPGAPVEPPPGLGGNLPTNQPPLGVTRGSAAHQSELGWDKLSSAEPEKLDLATSGRTSRVQAQDVAGMQQAKPQSGIALPTGAKVQDPKDQEKTDDMEDPSTWFEGIKLLKKLVREAK